ncbi:MAG: GGDEF domain-containing protein, partial [Micromonosporaceae bacterium]|nr:GGDEF domain-containing protein [Micromonosporaceae bacterium]
MGHALRIAAAAGLITASAAVGRLLTERRKLRSEIAQLRQRCRPNLVIDPLTGLPNRAGFGNLLGEALQQRPPTPTTVVVLRPTRTQLLDNLGSQDSDSAVAELAVRISSCLRPDYRLARTAES